MEIIIVKFQVVVLLGSLWKTCWYICAAEMIYWWVRFCELLCLLCLSCCVETWEAWAYCYYYL